MNILRLSVPLAECLDQPVPLPGDWDWAVWGRVDDVPELDATLQTGSDRIILMTADDTESRLLGNDVDGWQLPFAALPWMTGVAVPSQAISGTISGWGAVIAGAGGVIWAPASTRATEVLRPSLVPRPWRSVSAVERILIRPALVSPASSADAIALEAGWLQLADDLDGSHQCSQSIEGRGLHQSGDYWHAIMHRREPDYGNSQYWFHQFGRHPVFAKLAEEVPRVAATIRSAIFEKWIARLTPNGRWDPTAFVACCCEAASSDDAIFRTAVEELQYREMLLLLRQTLEDATE